MSKLIATAQTTTTPKLYLDFFKRYYKEKTRALVIISTILGAVLVLAGMYLTAQHIGNIYSKAILLAAGVMLIIYPRFSYRRPYNSVKNNQITTKFEFYDDKLIEINDSSREEYPYNTLLKVWETPQYFYIYHTKENASVVDKESFKKGTPDELAALLKTKLPFEKR